MKKLYNYFNNKLEDKTVRYGDDYIDHFRPYPPTGNYLKYSMIININKHITIDQPIIKHVSFT